MSSKSKDIFDHNIDRVNSLCNLYYSLKQDETKEKTGVKFTDLLRASVVMLHSSFEEYYRSILCERMPIVSDENGLKSICFPGSEGRHHDKITVGQLIEYRQKSVADLIADSISETLSYTSFNNYCDIDQWAKRASIDLSAFKEQSKMNLLISRRHKIVHEADNSKQDETYGLSPIKENTVREWISIVCDLVNIIETSIGA